MLPADVSIAEAHIALDAAFTQAIQHYLLQERVRLEAEFLHGRGTEQPIGLLGMVKP